MFFSVIIPTCNRNALLRKCLNLLAPGNQMVMGFDYEVIVSDDSSNDISKLLIEEKYNWVKWTQGPKRGPAANRNNGAKYAKGEWLIFIDDDCLPDLYLIDQFYKAITDNKSIEVFEGCIKADRECRSFIEESPINETGGYLWSCNFMINNNLFKNMQGFDEGFPFPAMEDVELNYRLLKAGKEILFVKDAYVIHPWRIQKRMFYVTMQRFKSLLYFLNKHPEQIKKLNSKYHLHAAFLGFIALVTKSFKYRFRGFGEKIISIIMHVYFALYLLFINRKFKLR